MGPRNERQGLFAASRKTADVEPVHLGRHHHATQPKRHGAIFRQRSRAGAQSCGLARDTDPPTWWPGPAGGILQPMGGRSARPYLPWHCFWRASAGRRSGQFDPLLQEPGDDRRVPLRHRFRPGRPELRQRSRLNAGASHIRRCQLHSSTQKEPMSTPPEMLYPELLAPFDMHAIMRDGQRLDHAEAASKPLRSRPESQPRGAKVHGSRPIDQAEAAARFIATPEHEKMHDERLWDLRQKRDREMLGIAEWEELRSLASAIKEHTLTNLDQYLEEFEANAR